MDSNILWQTFSETGDPLCWLIYRKAADISESRKENGGESLPRPAD